MATLRRYPLTESAIAEMIADLEKLREGLNIIPTNIVSNGIKNAETYFNAHLTGATPGRQAAINVTSSLTNAGKGTATGRLTATGETKHNDYGDFNILMAVEFGAGIAGVNGLGNTSYPALPMGTGTFPGQIHAFDYNGWLYPDEDGKWHRTFGTPATMPMHRTIQDMKMEMPRVVQEEINKWLT